MKLFVVICPFSSIFAQCHDINRLAQIKALSIIKNNGDEIVKPLPVTKPSILI